MKDFHKMHIQTLEDAIIEQDKKLDDIKIDDIGKIQNTIASRIRQQDASVEYKEIFTQMVIKADEDAVKVLNELRTCQKIDNNCMQILQKIFNYFYLADPINPNSPAVPSFFVASEKMDNIFR